MNIALTIVLMLLLWLNIQPPVAKMRLMAVPTVAPKREALYDFPLEFIVAINKLTNMRKFKNLV
jgi:hypothetical protein